MLVLTRQVGEQIIIGEHDCIITVTAVEVRGNKMRIGIDAPKDIPIHRAEIFEELVEAGELTRA